MKDLKTGESLIGTRSKLHNGKTFSKVFFKIYLGLLRVARRYLKVGGRLVFLYPTYEQESFDGANSLPKHEGFDIIDWSVNKLGKGNARVLVTL